MPSSHACPQHESWGCSFQASKANLTWCLPGSIPSKTVFLKSSCLSCRRTKKNSWLLLYKQMFLVMKTWNVNLVMGSTSWKLVCWHEAGKNNGNSKQWSSQEFRLLPWAIQIHKGQTQHLVTDKMDLCSLLAKWRISLYFAPSRECNRQKVLITKMSFTCPTTLYLHKTKGQV